MELEKLSAIENATWSSRQELFRLGAALLFIVGIMLFINSQASSVNSLLVIAGMIGGYMALNIGANDVANNVGPAVGSRALTLTGAILIAVIFEAAGALIAGGDVVGTIKGGIIDSSLIGSADEFVWLMMAALLAGALWLNLATLLGAPVSTTHAIVGGVLGAGMAAGGTGIVDWSVVSRIVASWVISPAIGGLIAAGFLYLIKRGIMYQTDRLSAAKRWVPWLIAIMAWAFGSYIVLKGLKNVFSVNFLSALLIGLTTGLIFFLLSSFVINRVVKQLENTKKGVNRLFVVPLIFAAALLSFAHGSNDVANAVGPLAAINDSLASGNIATSADIPIWVMMVGALGIALGLALYGPKLIRTVGSEITELDESRAYCIALSSALTVIIASSLGLPVSSTHIAVGAVFGVGFLREYLKANYARMINEIEQHHQISGGEEVHEFLVRFEAATIDEKGAMLQRLKGANPQVEMSKKDRRRIRRTYRHELVKRSALLKIVAAWIVTVPLSGLIAGILFFTIRGMMLE